MNITTTRDPFSQEPVTEFQDLQALLHLLVAKKQDEYALRLLDISVNVGRPIGTVFRLDILDYGTFHWLAYEHKGRFGHSFQELYKLIRHKLNWEGLVLMDVAA